jgi:hypothetical protein
MRLSRLVEDKQDKARQHRFVYTNAWEKPNKTFTRCALQPFSLIERICNPVKLYFPVKLKQISLEVDKPAMNHGACGAADLA